MADKFDVVIIGGGPGGYPASIRARQLGMSVACVEVRERLGGTCLNIGCIPSKALLESSHLYDEARHGLAAHGVVVSEVALNLPQMLAQKDAVVGDLGKGVEFLFKKNGVEHVRGFGRITGPGRVSVELNGGGTRELEARSIVIATGSDALDLPGVAVDEERVVSSTGALSLPEVPKRLLVIGGGYIGLELGSVWRRLGSEVTVVEYLDRITPGMDAEIAAQLQKVLQKQGFAFRLGAKVISAERRGPEVVVTVEPAKGGARETLTADVVLLSIGRRPYTDGLGLEELGVALDPKGRVVVDGEFRTNVEGVYAIGDVIAGPMLAHKAEEEGVVLMERLSGMRPHLNYGALPAVVYTWPEVATVGRTEEELKAEGIDYRVGRFPFMANARARAHNERDGLVKILADAKTDRILGVHIMGPDAGTMIPEATVAIEFGGAAEDLARTVHAHPTLPEAVREAALAVDGRALNI